MLLSTNMMEKFLQMMRSTLQSYTGETLSHDEDDSEKQVVDEETLTRTKFNKLTMSEWSENEEENDESQDKDTSM